MIYNICNMADPAETHQTPCRDQQLNPLETQQTPYRPTCGDPADTLQGPYNTYSLYIYIHLQLFWCIDPRLQLYPQKAFRSQVPTPGERVRTLPASSSLLSSSSPRCRSGMNSIPRPKRAASRRFERGQWQTVNNLLARRQCDNNKEFTYKTIPFFELSVPPPVEGIEKKNVCWR